MCGLDHKIMYNCFEKRNSIMYIWLKNAYCQTVFHSLLAFVPTINSDVFLKFCSRKWIWLEQGFKRKINKLNIALSISLCWLRCDLA